MKAERALRRGLAEVKRAWRAGRFEQALGIVEGLLVVSPANPSLLVMRAQLAQLQDAPDGRPTLEDAEADLKLAVRLDEHSPVPLVELGYLTHATKDDARAATRFFDEAIGRCRELLREALLGQAKALSELGRDAEALALLAEARGLHATRNTDELVEEFRTILQAN